MMLVVAEHRQPASYFAGTLKIQEELADVALNGCRFIFLKDAWRSRTLESIADEQPQNRTLIDTKALSDTFWRMAYI
jgi:hypothetical protein